MGECWGVSDVGGFELFVEGEDNEGGLVLDEVKGVLEVDMEDCVCKDGAGEWCVGISVLGDVEGEYDGEDGVV